MWPSCEKCGRLCVRFDDKLCVFHKADRGDYNRSKRGTRRKKAKQVEPENAKPVFPWSTKGRIFQWRHVRGLAKLDARSKRPILRAVAHD